MSPQEKFLKRNNDVQFLLSSLSIHTFMCWIKSLYVQPNFYAAN